MTAKIKNDVPFQYLNLIGLASKIFLFQTQSFSSGKSDQSSKMIHFQIPRNHRSGAFY